MNESHPIAEKQILIVEDHRLFRAMLVQLINQEPGLTVCGEADNLVDALKLVGQTQPDAAIVDLSLAGSSGLELIKDLRTRKIPLPVLALSMHAERHYAQRVVRAGAQGFVSKQESPAEVVAALHTVLAGKVHLSECIGGTAVEHLGHADETTPSAGVDLLSDRELEIYQLVGRGLTSREMARKLQLEPSTVDSYRARIKEKLGIKNAAELYQRAAQWLARRGL